MTEPSILSREQRIDLAEIALKEGRVAQGFWREDRDGREMVCALAALGPDINSSGECPADLMPRWMAAMVPAIDDGIKQADVSWFAGNLYARMRKWHVLDDAAWERIHTAFLIASIKRAIQSAEPVQPEPAPAYWGQVKQACDQVIAVLETGGDKAAARAAAYAADAADAAYAARAAADAAYAARAAAYAADAAYAAYAAYAADAADAAYAARAAAYAADAAYAARAAAYAADAAYAARAAYAADAAYAAWKGIGEILFQLIDVELEAAHVPA